jgi:L-ascorbate metabolism protein UlaG (beta-lactamase superfamily)
MIENIRALGHGSIQIAGPLMIYIDPWRMPATSFLADLVLVSHDHYDHFSPADISRLSDTKTRIVSNEKVAEQFEGVEVIRPFQSLSMDRTTVRAMPAYSQDTVHPRTDGGLGFVVSVNFYDIYYTGDTQLIPEMNQVRPDILILPIDGEGTMSVEDAVEATNLMRPRWVIPCNWGAPDRGTTRREAEEFRRMVGSRAEVILQT